MRRGLGADSHLSQWQSKWLTPKEARLRRLSGSVRAFQSLAIEGSAGHYQYRQQVSETDARTGRKHSGGCR
jgi:hypothetical protein